MWNCVTIYFFLGFDWLIIDFSSNTAAKVENCGVFILLIFQWKQKEYERRASFEI